MYSKLEIIGDSFSLEDDENTCYYKCLVVDYDNNEKTVILHETEVELFKTFIHLQKGACVYNETMKLVWLKVNNYLKHKKNI